MSANLDQDGRISGNLNNEGRQESIDIDLKVRNSKANGAFHPETLGTALDQ